MWTLMRKPVRTAILLFFSALVVGCTGKAGRMASTEVLGLPLPPADYEILEWVSATACSNYVLGYRMPEGGRNGAGYLSRGTVIGGALGDPDSAAALYQAMQKVPTASYLLMPRFDLEVTGFSFMGRMFFGRRCSTVEVRGVALGTGPFEAGRPRAKVKPPPEPDEPKLDPGAKDFR